jgi:prevent-host-death family protein
MLQIVGRSTMPTMTSREFNQDVARAKRAANDGPVVITDRGKPAYVLMRHDTYRRLSKQGPSLRELLAHPESEDVEFDPPRMGDEPLRPADLD